MRAEANRYPKPDNLAGRTASGSPVEPRPAGTAGSARAGAASATAGPTASPILCIDRDTAQDHELLHLHSHPEPMLTWSSTATLMGTIARRDWLIPPGYGLWVPGGIEHAGAVLHAGEMLTITFAADRCPITWTEPTCFTVGSLLSEIITHLHDIAPGDHSRPAAEALMFELLTPLPAHDIHVTMPADSRARAIAEQLIAHPGDQRELTAWADHVHASARTLSRLFRAETGLNFATWRTHVRIRAAIPMLAHGTSVNATARAVGYRKPSAFIAAFRRVTGQTPGTYLPHLR